MIEQITFLKSSLKKWGLNEYGAPLRGLGKIVVLAGPNGAGKTRYLNCLIDTIGVFKNSIAQPSEKIKTQIVTLEKQLTNLDIRTDRASPKVKKRKNSLIQQVKRYEDQLINRTLIKTVDVHINANSQIFPLQLKCNPNTPFANAWDLSPFQIRQELIKLNSNDFHDIYNAIHCYLNEKARFIYARKHPDHEKDSDYIEQFKKAIKFNELLTNILNTNVGYKFADAISYGTNEVIPILFNRSFSESELSKGQKLLLAWATYFFERSDELNNNIIIIDEPENHMHPDVCIQVIETLVNKLLPQNGQLWIATHSVPLIAYAGTDSLYLVDDGKIQYAGNKIDTAMNRLLGGEDGRRQLREMLSDAEEIGFFQYASECLIKPQPVPEQDQGKQQSLFSSLIKQKVDNGESLKLLDYGAGKGRMAHALSQELDEEMKKHLEYYAYEMNSDYNESCKKNIGRFYGQDEIDECFSNDFEHFTSPHEHTFDVVLLCNTLHEIDDTKWIDLFKKIKSLLKEDGLLIIMEVQRMPSGELAHKKGFIVLDEFGIKDLFIDDGSINVICSQNDDRLVAFEIPRGLLESVSNGSLIKAFRTTSERAMEKVDEIREITLENPAAKLGRDFAFHCLQYTNANRALKRLS